MTTKLFDKEIMEDVKKLGDTLLDELKKYFSATDNTEEANKQFGLGIIKEFENQTWKKLGHGTQRLRYLREELGIIDADENTVKNITAGLNRVFGQVCGYGSHDTERQRELLRGIMKLDQEETIESYEDFLFDEQ
jgi:hypothetical protein